MNKRPRNDDHLIPDKDFSIPDPLQGDFEEDVQEEIKIKPPEKPLVIRLIKNNWQVIIPILTFLLLARCSQ